MLRWDCLRYRERCAWLVRCHCLACLPTSGLGLAGVRLPAVARLGALARLLGGRRKAAGTAATRVLWFFQGSAFWSSLPRAHKRGDVGAQEDERVLEEGGGLRRLASLRPRRGGEVIMLSSTLSEDDSDDDEPDHAAYAAHASTGVWGSRLRTWHINLLHWLWGGRL